MPTEFEYAVDAYDRALDNVQGLRSRASECERLDRAIVELGSKKCSPREKCESVRIKARLRRLALNCESLGPRRADFAKKIATAENQLKWRKEEMFRLSEIGNSPTTSLSRHSPPKRNPPSLRSPLRSALSPRPHTHPRSSEGACKAQYVQPPSAIDLMTTVVSPGSTMLVRDSSREFSVRFTGGVLSGTAQKRLASKLRSLEIAYCKTELTYAGWLSAVRSTGFVVSVRKLQVR